MAAGNAAFGQRQYAEAQQRFEDALDAAKSFGADPRKGDPLMGLADVAAAQGGYAEAEDRYRQAGYAYGMTLLPTDQRIADGAVKLADMMRRGGRDSEAAALYTRVVDIEEHAPEGPRPALATHLITLAGIYVAMGKYDQAEPLYLKALALRETRLAPTDPLLAQTLSTIALFYGQRGRCDEGQPYMRRYLSISQDGSPAANAGEMEKEWRAFCEATKALLAQQEQAAKQTKPGKKEPAVGGRGSANQK